MEEIDLVSKDTVADLIKQKFESPLPKCQDDDDPFVKVVTITISQPLSEACFVQGEFDVIKGLLENYPIMVEAKRKIDRVGFPTTSLNL